MESKEESTVTKSSGLEKSSSGLVVGKRKHSAPKFITPLNGCIVDQGTEVLLSAIIEGKVLIIYSYFNKIKVCDRHEM